MTLADDIRNYVRNSPAHKAVDGTVAGLESDYVLVKRSDLPEVTYSGHHGFTTALAQQGYQPMLRVEGEPQDSAPEWSEKIAYANLAIAEAIRSAARESEARLQARRDELADRFAPRPGDLKPNWYGNVSDGLRAAIDYIIEMEAAAERDGGKA